MRFLFLILAVAPVLGTEFHSRERRQAHAQQPNYQAYNQAPATIKQILVSQQAREPIVHLPQQPVPNLSPSSPIEPQYLKQSELIGYRPQVHIGQAPQQPTYKQIPVKPAQYNPPAGAQLPQYNNPQPQYRANYASAPQPQPVPQPRPLPQPQHLQQAAVAEPNYQYSKDLPPHLQQFLQFQLKLANTIPQGHHQG